MPADQELVLIFGALHLMALTFGALLLRMFLHSSPLPGWRPPDDEDDGGGGGEPPPSPDPGGPPLELAGPARARLREPGRIAECYPRPGRRPEHEPVTSPERRTAVSR